MTGFNQTKLPDNTMELTFDSKNIPGSPVGLLFFIGPAVIALIGWILMKIDPNIGGGTMVFIWIVGSFMLSTAAYFALNNLIFTRNHKVVVVMFAQSISFDGKDYNYADIKSFEVRESKQQGVLYMLKDGREIKMTGWMDWKTSLDIQQIIRK